MTKRELADELGKAEMLLQVAVERHYREGSDESRRAWMAAIQKAERLSIHVANLGTAYNQYDQQ